MEHSLLDSSEYSNIVFENDIGAAKFIFKT